MKSYSIEAKKLKDLIILGNSEDSYYHPQENIRVENKYSFIINKLVENVDKNPAFSLTSLKLIDSVILDFIKLDLDLTSLVLNESNTLFYNYYIELLELNDKDLESKYISKILIALSNKFTNLYILKEVV